jgi:energy-coupling factor transport system permease protein
VKGTSIGVYLPGDTPVHHLDPRVKLGVAVVFAIALFATRSGVALLAIGLLVAATIAIARIPLAAAARGVRAVAFILAFTVLAQTLKWEPPTAMLWLGPIGLSAQGLVTGLLFASRILILVVGTSVVTLTTTPMELTDALEWSMRPLGKVGLPAHDIAMMLSIALRFIPLTADVADQVLTAHRARGARLDHGGLVTRARAWVPVLVPLFVDLFRRADRLAHAMEARCYRGGTSRTRLHELLMRPADWAVLLGASTALIAIVAVLGRSAWPR